MSQPKPLFWLQAGQTVCNYFVLSAKQSTRTSNFNVSCLTQLRIEPPTSRMPGERSTTTLPRRSVSKNNWDRKHDLFIGPRGNEVALTLDPGCSANVPMNNGARVKYIGDAMSCEVHRGQRNILWGYVMKDAITIYTNISLYVMIPHHSLDEFEYNIKTDVAFHHSTVHGRSVATYIKWVSVIKV